MITEYERYHGTVIRELVVRSPRPLIVGKHVQAGRVNSFSLNGQMAIHIKHSAKRLPPWQFTITSDNQFEIDDLIQHYSSFWLALVCGLDGIITLSAQEFQAVTAAQSDVTRFIRVDRDRNTMYRVYGNAGKLQTAKPRGVKALLSDAALFEKPL